MARTEKEEEVEWRRPHQRVQSCTCLASKFHKIIHVHNYICVCMYKKCSKKCAYSFIEATNATQKLQHTLYTYIYVHMSHTLTVHVYSCCPPSSPPPLPHTTSLLFLEVLPVGVDSLHPCLDLMGGIVVEVNQLLPSLCHREHNHNSHTSYI